MIFSLFSRPVAEPATRAADIELSGRRLIIYPELLPGDDGNNINGPSLIRAPGWLKEPLGRYYLYFAHHTGTYVRLATADHLDGPWTIHRVLHLSQVPTCRGHIASPDVHADHEARTIRMYFHGIVAEGKGQKSFLAISFDGLNFAARPEALGPSYFRAFRYEGFWFALAKGGRLYRSRDGLTDFEAGNDAFPVIRKNPKYNRPGSVRHVAIDIVGKHTQVYYSRIGDNPERILRSQMDLTGHWLNWCADRPEEVARPEEEWEGSTLPHAPSRKGQASGPVRELRDPCIFVDEDHSKYLLYSVAGEQGIAIAKLDDRHS